MPAITPRPDLSLVTDIHLKIGHVFEIAEQRRAAGERVRSAFFADTTVGFGIARLYEELMKGATIQVRAFRDRDAAAEWLGVTVQLSSRSEARLRPGSHHRTKVR